MKKKKQKTFVGAVAEQPDKSFLVLFSKKGLLALAGPAAATLLMLIVLIGLGIWQLHRLAWKESLLAEVARAEQGPPTALGPNTPPRFAKIAAQGVLRTGKTAFYGAQVRDIAGVAHMGAQLIALIDVAEAGKPILVDLGWVATDAASAPALPSQSAPVSVVGYMRPAEHAGLLAASDDVAGLHFYTLDPALIGAALGAANVAPYTLVAMGTAPSFGQAVPATEFPHPVNNHLQYALTWFGLAGALAVIFVIWVRGPVR